VVAGWLVTWGAAALAASALVQAGVDVGLGLGLADDQGAEGFWPGAWVALIQLGAFMMGGYLAARLVRHGELVQASLVWLLAMVATGIDAVVAQARGTGGSVLADLLIPRWTDSGLDGSGTPLALGFLAVLSLVGAIVGGLLAERANGA
jgi:hypothetical protein